MKKYIIKTTYLEGEHKGKTFFLNKGGYVIDNLEYVWQDSSYTLAACKAVCTRKAKENKRNHELELAERAYREQQGKKNSKYMIWELKSFEPYEIETVDR